MITKTLPLKWNNDINVNGYYISKQVLEKGIQKQYVDNNCILVAWCIEDKIAWYPRLISNHPKGEPIANVKTPEDFDLNNRTVTLHIRDVYEQLFEKVDCIYMCYDVDKKNIHTTINGFKEITKIEGIRFLYLEI